MPANLTPQYLSAEQRFKEAATTEEKIAALEEMMAVIPKHKGTEKLQADLKRRLAKLRNEAIKKHGTSRLSSLYTVQKEGAGQIVLVGAPNVGKSSILARLTHATPEIADYPFTTRLPQPGMMPYENVLIQIVDMPPIAPEYYEPWMGNIVRQCDLVLLVADLSHDEVLEELDGALTLLGNSKIRLAGTQAAPKIDEPVSVTRRTALLAANKCDASRALENLEILREFFAAHFEIVVLSAASGEGIDALRPILFERLGVIRVYTKAPGKKADLHSPPFILKRGGTVLDATRAVHRDFVHSLKFARVWSSERSKRSVKHEGQMVERTHQLEDGDILELHV